MDASKRELAAGDDAGNMKVFHLTVQAQTASKLRDAILSGIFRPGDRLIEADLCQRMGVSRTSIREALRSLEAERLVTIIPNRGPSVTEITWDEAQEIYDARALLEGEAAALFAVRASSAELGALKLALDEFDRVTASSDSLERIAATARFYEVILNGCGNRIIAETLHGLVARISFLRARSMSEPGRARLSAAEMRQMYNAIKSNKASAARNAAIEHVRAACAAACHVYAEQTTHTRKA